MYSAPEEVAVFVNPSGKNQYVKDLIPRLKLIPTEKFHLVTLSENLPEYAKFPDGHRKERVESVLKTAAEDELTAMASEFEKNGINNFELHNLTGRFPFAISDWMNGKPSVELLIKQSLECDGDFGNASKGDVKLTRLNKVSTLMLHSEVRSTAPVVVGIPPIFEDKRGLALAVKTLQSAAWWSKIFDSPVRLVRAYELFGETLLRRRSSKEEIAEYLEQAKREAEREVQVVIDEAKLDSDIKIDTQILKGDPTQVLLGTIKLAHPSLVVLGSVANDGLRGVLLGNTAETILRRQEAAVSVIR